MNVDPETLEAEVRKLMAAHAAIKPRGFDTIRQRDALHRRIDDLLDQYEPRDVGAYAPYLATFTPDSHPAATTCGLCGTSKRWGLCGVYLCFTCDGQPASPHAWTAIPDDQDQA